MTKPKQIGAGEQGDQQALTPLQVQQMQFEGTLNLIRELAVNPNVDPDKLSKILDLQERIMDKNAEQQFNDAMHKAQQEMSFIRTDQKNKDKGNVYASYKALDRHIRPIYTKHGFSVSFDTGPGKPEYGPIRDGEIRILMDIAHSAGWKVQKHTDIPVETTGAQGAKMMTKTHATGSGMSYGKRYLLIFGFNLAVGEEDDDGNKAGAGGGGGKDHRFTEPSPKSGGKKKGVDKVVEPGAMAKKFPDIKRAGNDGERLTNSNTNTMLSTMKRQHISEERFTEDFGFPVSQCHKGGLNSIIDWIKEVS